MTEGYDLEPIFTRAEFTPGKVEAWCPDEKPRRRSQWICSVCGSGGTGDAFRETHRRGHIHCKSCGMIYVHSGHGAGLHKRFHSWELPIHPRPS